MLPITKSTHQHHRGRQLISELCRVLKDLRTPTGLSIAIRENDYTYMAPACDDSHYDIRPEDVIVFDRLDNIISRPSQPYLRMDELGSLFLAILKLRAAEACIYTTSKDAAQVSMMFENEFRMSNVQLSKTVRKDPPVAQGSTVVIPIVDFCEDKDEMLESVVSKLLQCRDSQAIIFRGRGICVWEDSWPRAKAAMEFVQYLMQLAIQMNTLQVPFGHLHRGSSLGPYQHGARTSYIRLS